MKNVKTVILLISTVLILQMALCPVWAAGEATVVFKDTFENLSVGATPGAAETGSWQISVTSPSQAEVTENIGNNTGKCLLVRRALGTSGPTTKGVCVSGEGTYEAYTTMIAKWDYYMSSGPETQAEWYSIAGFSMNPATGGGGFEAGWNIKRFPPTNYYRYVLPGPGWLHTFVDTDMLAEYSKWMSFEIDMYFEPNEPGFVSGTYDLFVTPEDGVKTVLAENVPLRLIAPVGPVRFQIWPDAPENYEWGGDVVNYWDNFSVEKLVTPRCDDMYHNYPPGDVNKDCYIDLTDFALLMAEWLDCTDVNCP